MPFLGCLVLYWQSFISLTLAAKQWTFMPGSSFSGSEWNSFSAPETVFFV
jgi:hypothetical protein